MVKEALNICLGPFLFSCRFSKFIVIMRSFNDLIALAKNKGRKRIAIIAAEDEVIINSVITAYKLGIVEPVLMGNFSHLDSTLKNKISEFELNHFETPEESTVFAVELWRNNKVQCLMKGLVSTKTVLHEVLKHRSILVSANILNHLALFELESYHKLLGLTDAAIAIEPSVQQRYDAIKNCIDALKKLSIECPHIAILSAIEKVNRKIISSSDAQYIKNLIEDNSKSKAKVAGPIAFDLAISAEAAKIKNYRNDVAGNADLLVVPELVSGNILYKSLTYMAGAQCASVVLGAKSPIILTSRADSEQSKLYSIALGLALL